MIRFDATSTGREGDIQTYIIPTTGVYLISAAGAKGGGDYGGRGALVSVVRELSAGDELQIAVGQAAPSGWASGHGSGGGASFVAKVLPDTSLELLLAAGGGGANDHQPDFHQEHGRITADGGTGQRSGSGGLGSPGTDGNGGSGNSTAYGGAGWLSGNDGNAPGGMGGSGCTAASMDGGFGGGGSSNNSGWGRCGGGGGYSGGAGARGSTWAVAGGGGSYGITAFEDATEGGNTDDDGWVEIVPPPAPPADAPENIIITALSFDSISLTYDPVLGANPEILSHTVEIREGATVLDSYTGSDTSLSFTGLPADTALTIAVYATNAEGDGPEQTKAFSTPPDSAPVDAPDGLLVTVERTGFTIAWDEFVPNAADYVVRLQTPAGDTIATNETGGFVSSFAAPDPVATSTRYQISVTGRNAQGEGPAATAIVESSHIPVGNAVALAFDGEYTPPLGNQVALAFGDSDTADGLFSISAGTAVTFTAQAPPASVGAISAGATITFVGQTPPASTGNISAGAQITFNGFVVTSGSGNISAGANIAGDGLVDRQGAFDISAPAAITLVGAAPVLPNLPTKWVYICPDPVIMVYPGNVHDPCAVEQEFPPSFVTSPLYAPQVVDSLSALASLPSIEMLYVKPPTFIQAGTQEEFAAQASLTSISLREALRRYEYTESLLLDVSLTIELREALKRYDYMEALLPSISLSISNRPALIKYEDALPEGIDPTVSITSIRLESQA